MCRVKRPPPGDDSDVAVDEGRQLRLGKRAYLGGLDVAVLEKHQRGYAAYAVSGRCLRVVIDIEFGNLDLTVIFAGDFIEYRRNHLAGAAPFRPVVDQYGIGGVQDFGFKIIVCHINDVFTHSSLSPAD